MTSKYLPIITLVIVFVFFEIVQFEIVTNLVKNLKYS